MILKRIHLVTPLLLFLFSAIVAIPQLKTPMYTETDPYIHSLTAKAFKDSGSLNTLYTGLWLPLYPLLLGGALHVLDDFTLTPRVVNLLFSSGTVVLVYFYCRELLDLNSREAVLAGLIYLFFPYRFLISTFPFTEQVFVFFLLLALILILKDSPRYIWGVGSFMVAQGIRYEAWYLTPLIMWYVYKSAQSSRIKRVLILVLIIVPFLWLAINYYSSNDFLLFLTNMRNSSLENFSHAYLNFNYSILNWWRALVELFSIPVLLFSLVGFLVTLTNKKDKSSVGFIISIIIFFALVYQSFAAILEWFARRYLLIILPFVVAYLIVGLKKIIVLIHNRFLKKDNWFLILFVIGVVMITITHTYYLLETANRLRYGSFFPTERIRNFNELVDLCTDQKCGDELEINYYARKTEPLHQFFTLRFYTGILTYIEEQSVDFLSAETLPANGLMIIEKEDSAEYKNFYFDNAETLLNNSSFLVLKVKIPT
ncbi:hypothetical protein KJ707_02575 [Patescibacteria group bacterium]|nr:hypothetical protein [Patescibacteria group bacterium]